MISQQNRADVSREERKWYGSLVFGMNKPYFAGPRPPLRLMTHDRIGEDVIRLTYVPA